METRTWKRENGFVSVVVFANKASVAVSTKTYATQKGAEAANKKLVEMCGDNWEKQNLPWQSTDIETGEITTHYRRENVVAVK